MCPLQELDRIAKSIKEVGQLVPIKMYEAQILDGRNRFAACQIADVEPTLEDITDSVPDPYVYVMAMNGDRRHLTHNQLALAAAEYSRYLERTEMNGRKRDVAAKLFDIGARTVGYARRIADEACPEVVSRVESGEMTLVEADKMCKYPHEDQQKILNGTYEPKKRAEGREVAPTKTTDKGSVRSQIIELQEPYRNMRGALRRFKMIITQEIQKPKIGMHVKTNRNRLSAAVEELLSCVDSLTPAGFCVTCSRKGCDLCNHSGFLTKSQYERMKAEE